MADTFIDSIVPAAQAARAPRAAGPASNAPVEDVVGDGGRIVPLNRDGSSAESLDVTEDGGRVLPEGVKAKLAAIAEARRASRDSAAAEHGDDDAAPDEDDPDAPPGDVTADAPAESKPGEPAVKAATPAADDPVAELRAKIAHYEERNRALVEQHAVLEAEHKKTRERPEPPKLLVEAHTNYVEDQIGAMRRFIAASLGVDNPDDAAVTAEMRDLFTDLTALHLGVTPDPSHTAKREAARAKQLFAREKRERKAAEESVAQRGSADADTKKDADAAQFIGTRLKADDFPHLHALSKDLDGLEPAQLLWKVMQREIKTGKLDPTKGDDALIKGAAELVENHYQALVQKAQAIKKPSTDKPIDPKSTAAASSARTEQRQSHGARTLTAADASVAPTPPPPKKPKSNETPKFKSKEERQRYALRHIRATK